MAYYLSFEVAIIVSFDDEQPRSHATSDHCTLCSSVGAYRAKEACVARLHATKVVV